MTKTTTSNPKTNPFTAYAEATALMGASFDRLVRNQAGHAAAVSRETTEFMTQSLDSALKANEAFRRAGIETMETATAAMAR